MPINPTRRTLLHSGLMAGLGGLALGGVGTARALVARTLGFPRDHGGHPDTSTEWWYATGAVKTSDKSAAREFGFQVTFFRSRVPATQGMTSKFAAKQLMFAHAAITDVQGKVLLHDQRILRDGFDLARAGTQDTDVKIKDWSLKREAGAAGDAGFYTAHVVANGFTLDLKLALTQPLLLQGDQGLSRKGPQEAQASFYYSQPQLAASGQMSLEKNQFDVSGSAWLDHEWSDALMHPDAVGWDWIGMNLFDGSALTAFQLRNKAGAPMWDGGSFRSAKGLRYSFSKGEVVFSRQRSWKSPLSQASYPVEWIVRTPADFYTVKAVLPNQELDSRASTGAIYWEGLSELFDSNGQLVGRGYLEMTGYSKPLRL